MKVEKKSKTKRFGKMHCSQWKNNTQRKVFLTTYSQTKGKQADV
jgi:hypothetical protein